MTETQVPRPSARTGNVWRSASKVAVFIACLLPLAWVVWLAFTPGVGGSGLGPNPQEFLNRYLGGWAIRFLLIALAVTPIRMLLRWNWVFRFRRMFGLYAFFYVCLHLSSYIVLDKQFFWDEIWSDIVKRTYITIGMASFLLLIPLAVTSTAGMVRRLGAMRWRRLHQIIYVIAPLACIHFFMMRKGIQLEPMIYGGVAVALLMVRLWHRVWHRPKSRRSAG